MPFDSSHLEAWESSASTACWSSTATARLLVDAGMMFPHGNLPGIDSIVPDFEPLTSGPDLAGIVLTHGHEDHLGGLPFAIKAASAPVYGSPYTLALAKRRLREREVSCDLRTLALGQPVELGPFRRPSGGDGPTVPQSCGLVIETPGGSVVFTGDFKLGGSSSYEPENRHRHARRVGTQGRPRPACRQHEHRAGGFHGGRGARSTGV